MKTFGKIVLTFIIIGLLLSVSFNWRSHVDDYIDELIELDITNISVNERYSLSEKIDSLLVISLNMRFEDRKDLAFAAIQKADFLNQEIPEIKGLLGLYYLENNQDQLAIDSWILGAKLAPDDPNLPFLATMELVELPDIDHHMLEQMFVKSLINNRLETKLYQQPDIEVFSIYEKKIRIQDSINGTFIIASLLALITIIVSFKKVKKIRNRNIESSGHVYPKTISYVVMFSSFLKIGQIVAGGFNCFMLGSDISEFLSNYLLVPENLIELFSDNILFAIIFLVVIIASLVRKRLEIKK